MSGLPIDINTSASPVDNTGSRANRSRRDGNLRGPQFEQLLLALTSKSKPLPCGVSEVTTTQSTSKTSLADHSDGPAANATRYASSSDSSSAVAQTDDDSENDVEVEASSDEETTPDEPASPVDLSTQVVACTFENHKLPTKPDAPTEEPTHEAPAIEKGKGESKDLARGLDAKALPTEPVEQGQAITANDEVPADTLPIDTVPADKVPADTVPVDVVKEDHSHELTEAPPDLTLVTTDQFRRASGGRQRKVASDDQAAKAEQTTNPKSDVAAATSDNVQQTVSRGDKRKSLHTPDVQNGTEIKPEASAVATIPVVDPAATEASQSLAAQEPTAKEGLKEIHSAKAADAPKSAVPVNAPVTPPPVDAPATVVPPVAAMPTQQPAAQTTNSSGASNSKNDATSGVTTTAANRLPHRAIATARSNGPQGSSQIDTVKFIQRIARAMQTAREAGGEIRLRLSPPELGSMKMEVKVQDGTLVARVETETAQAQSTLVDNLPALKERLAEQGVRIERFDVDVSRDDRGGNGFAQQNSNPDRGSQPQSDRRVALHRQVTDPTDTASPSSPITTPQSINVVA